MYKSLEAGLPKRAEVNSAAHAKVARIGRSRAEMGRVGLGDWARFEASIRIGRVSAIGAWGARPIPANRPAGGQASTGAAR